MEIINITKKKLEYIGEDYDYLKPFMQNYLDKVEEIIQDKEKCLNEALKIIKKSSYNVSEVSKQLGCSRTTLYNHNQLLKRYIEASIVISNKNNPYVAYDELKESRQKLQEQINLMENRDIDMEVQKHEKRFSQIRFLNKQKR